MKTPTPPCPCALALLCLAGKLVARSCFLCMEKRGLCTVANVPVTRSPCEKISIWHVCCPACAEGIYNATISSISKA